MDKEEIEQTLRTAAKEMEIRRNSLNIERESTEERPAILIEEMADLVADEEIVRRLNQLAREGRKQ